MSVAELSSHLENEFEVVLQYLAIWLPGPITPQKILGLDTGNKPLQTFMEQHYGQVVDTCLDKLGVSWPSGDMIEVVQKVLVVEGGNAAIFETSLLKVVAAIRKMEGPSKRLDFLVDLLSRLVTSDSLFAALADGSMSSEVMQTLMALPSYVANKLKQKCQGIFIPRTYCQVLCYQISKLIRLILQASSKGFVCDTSSVSELLGKIVVNFCSEGYPGLVHLVKILECLCSEFENVAVLHKIFTDLPRQCIFHLSIVILKTCSCAKSVHSLLGVAVVSSLDWRYIMCNKIPLLIYLDWKDGSLLKHLVGYLALVDIKMVTNLLFKLLEVWGDKSALNHTSLEQHIYITEAILACIANLEISKERPTSKSQIVEKLFAGIPVHLDSTIKPVRAIGMITAEIAMETSVFIPNKESKPILKFEYGEMEPETKEIVEKLRIYVLACSERADKKPTQSGLDMLLELGRNCTIIEGDNLNLVVNHPALQNQISVSSVTVERGTNSPIPDKEETLDSDDDLEPYDLSNDVELSVRKRPKYLRDLRDGLLESEDPDIYTGSLEVAETLIRSQLPDDDSAFGLQLLEVLMCLEERFCMQNWDELRFSAAVSIIEIYPGPSAEFISSQFNAKIGQYSVAQKMFMLDILAESARRLSNRTCKGSKTALRNVNEAMKTDIQQRIEKNTRRFSTAPKPKESVNRYAAVANSFFFPLVHDFGQTSVSFCSNDNFLLAKFLNTLATLVICAENSQTATRMGHELLRLVWVVRFHNDAQVRLGVMVCVAAVVMVVPQSRLQGDLYDLLGEFHVWLMEGLQDPNKECRQVSTNVAAMIEGITSCISLPTFKF